MSVLYMEENTMSLTPGNIKTCCQHQLALRVWIYCMDTKTIWKTVKVHHSWAFHRLRAGRANAANLSALSISPDATQNC